MKTKAILIFLLATFNLYPNSDSTNNRYVMLYVGASYLNPVGELSKLGDSYGGVWHMQSRINFNTISLDLSLFGLGNSVESLDYIEQQEIIPINYYIYGGLSVSYSRLFYSDKKFYSGIGIGFGHNLLSLNSDDNDKQLEQVSSNSMSVGLDFHYKLKIKGEFKLKMEYVFLNFNSSKIQNSDLSGNTTRLSLYYSWNRR